MAKESLPPSRRFLSKNVFRFIKFCLVGGSGVFVDMVVFYMCIDSGLLSLPVWAGKLIAGETAMINNFLWNERWTFVDRRGGEKSVAVRLKRFVKFNGLCLIGLMIALISIVVFHHVIGLNPYFSNILAIIVATFWNFFFKSSFQLGNGT